MAGATCGWSNLLGQCSNSGTKAVGSVSGYFWSPEGRSSEKENIFQTPSPPPPQVSQLQVGLWSCRAQAQRGPAAHVSPSGLLLLHEAAAGGCSCCGTGRGDPFPALRSPDPRADLSRLFPGSTTEVHSSAAATWRGVFSRAGVSPYFLRRFIA